MGGILSPLLFSGGGAFAILGHLLSIMCQAALIGYFWVSALPCMSDGLIRALRRLALLLCIVGQWLACWWVPHFPEASSEAARPQDLLGAAQAEHGGSRSKADIQVKSRHRHGHGVFTGMPPLVQCQPGAILLNTGLLARASAV